MPVRPTNARQGLTPKTINRPRQGTNGPDQSASFSFTACPHVARQWVENTHCRAKVTRCKPRSRGVWVEPSIPLIITIVLMNFYIDFARVALASYPLYRPPTEHPIMKRQLILSLTLAVLAANAYALPAREQAAPQAQASHATVSQVLNTLASDGSDHTTFNKKEDNLSEGGSDRTPLGQALAADGSSKTAIGKNDELAEGGRARLEEKGLVQDGGDRVIERNSSLS